MFIFYWKLEEDSMASNTKLFSVCTVCIKKQGFSVKKMFQTCNENIMFTIDLTVITYRKLTSGISKYFIEHMWNEEKKTILFF